MILLDTHVLLWVLARGDRIGPQARRVTEQAGVRYVSAVTFAEIAIKGARNKLRAPGNLSELITDLGFVPLPLDARHASGLRRFPTLGRHDPFDRLLVAQADVDRLTLLTADSTLLALEQPWIIDATR